MSEKFRKGANPMKWSRTKTFLTCAFLVLAMMACDVRSASALPTGKVMAIPAFARKYGLPCSACHTAWPELNNFGQVFRDNGYQLMNDRDSPIWQNPSYFPISFRITPNWHRETANNQAIDSVPGNGDGLGIGKVTQSGFDLSGMDLWSAGTLYKNISFVLLPSSDPTAVWHFESAFIRFDNLKGSPWLNVKFGRFELDNMISEKRFLFLSNNGGIYQIYHFNAPGSSNNFGYGDNQIGVELAGHSANSYTRYSIAVLGSNEGGVGLTTDVVPGAPPGSRSYDVNLAFSQAFNTPGFSESGFGQARVGAFAYIGQRPTNYQTYEGTQLVGIDNKPFFRIGFAGDLTYKNLELMPLFMYGHDNPYLGTLVPSTDTLPTGAQAPTFYGGFLEAHYYLNPQNVAMARFEQINVGQQSYNAAAAGVPGSYGNITGYSFGYRWYPIMFSRAGVALDGEYSRVRTIGNEPESGDGSGTVGNPTAAVWSSSIFFGIDFDF
ncbi:MAG: hypothetical protein WA192_06700 [Candidatus Acidiferrales bacterium]